MSERGVIFADWEVRATLDGRKTMFRRVVTPMRGRQKEWLDMATLHRSPSASIGRSHEGDGYGDLGAQFEHPRGGPLGWIRCPFGRVGDRLFVKETWAHNRVLPLEHRPIGAAIYRADLTNGVPTYDAVWCSSSAMPRWASRITLEIIDVRVERLNSISEDDARAEGIPRSEMSKTSFGVPGMSRVHFLRTAKESFAVLWNRTHGKRHPWASNPWVWAVSFKRVAP